MRYKVTVYNYFIIESIAAPRRPPGVTEKIFNTLQKYY